jgi:hypothetical protein
MDTKMENTMELLVKTNSELAETDQTYHGLKPAELAGHTYPEAEAGLAEELDRITELSDRDPLQGLDQIVSLMQGLNTELLKASAPALVENARIKADHFLAKGKIIEDKREGHRAFTQFLHLQEAIVKLGVAQTKVRDELQRRNS